MIVCLGSCLLEEVDHHENIGVAGQAAPARVPDITGLAD